MKVASRRPHIEDALELSLSDLIANGLVARRTTVHGTLRWKRRSGVEHRVFFVSVVLEKSGTMVLNYTTPHSSCLEEKSVSCLIQLSSTSLHLGGRRFWMHCPSTNRRATKLYMFPGVDYFCHRTAIDPLPTYESQRVSGLDRIQNQRRRIRRLLKCQGGSYDILSKPKWMRWNTFEKYSRKDAPLEDLEIDIQLQWMERMKAKRARRLNLMISRNLNLLAK